MNPLRKRQEYFLQEMHLLDSQHNNKNQPAKTNSFDCSAEACCSTSATTAGSIGYDDYGECDLSLTSYNSDVHSSLVALSLEEATELLYESLKEYPPFTTQIHFEHMIGGSCPPRESYTFTAGNDLIVKVHIRMDVQRILFSTVVHMHERQQDQSPPTRRSYTLMTKMMKYNALLGRTMGRGRVVPTCGGSFVFFQDVDMGNLYGTTTSRRSKLSDSTLIEDFLLTAMEIRRDFGRSKDARNRSTFGWLH
jgi:hypothetical protein